MRDPRSPIERYVAAALESARARELEEGIGWVAHIEGFPGVWADGASKEECLRVLDEVLREWLFIKVAAGDDDIPVVAGINRARARGVSWAWWLAACVVVSLVFCVGFALGSIHHRYDAPWEDDL